MLFNAEIGQGVVVLQPLELEGMTVSAGEHARIHSVDEKRGLTWFKLDRYHWSLARDQNCFVLPDEYAVETLSLMERNPINELSVRLADSLPSAS
jgi:hypothetical protein